MNRAFSRLAVVNRGESAMRAIHAVRELNVGRTEPMRVIALFTEAERDAMFVRHADEAVLLAASNPGVPYLDHDALERALRACRADAAWVGWGFVAEQPEFAELCERLGIVFIGPDPAAMRRLGDKIAAKRLAESAGVPVAPWSNGPVASAAEAAVHAQRIGFPLMIKAAAGGGGRGIRRVDAPDALDAAFGSAQAEARVAFGDGTLLMERLIAPARHIEVQVIADGFGNAWSVGVRDCSYQRRNQKVLEESASPALTEAQHLEIREAARRLVLEAGYSNAGTVEFLYEPATRRFSFMEVNARLQVEHPVTEAVTGLDLVKLQLHIAAGGRLDGSPPQPTGHAIEARLNAEDPALGFAPAPGRLVHLRLPTGPGLRVDTGVAEGDVIPEAFDSMIGKLIAWGRDRDEALARLRRAVADTIVVVDGGTTNQGFLLELLDRPEVRAGDVDTGWLDRLSAGGGAIPARHCEVALIQAAIDLAQADDAAERARFYAFARHGRPQTEAELSRTYELRHHGHTYRLEVAQIAPERYRVSAEGTDIDVRLRPVGSHERRLSLGRATHRTLTSRQGEDLLVEVDGVPHRVSRDDGGIVRNLSPALVVSVPVATGDIVDEGDVVAVVEAMKMESSLTAPFHGRVKQVLVGENVHVGAQAPLLVLEPVQDRGRGPQRERLSFAEHATPSPAAHATGTEALARLGWMIRGYDVTGAERKRALDDLRAADRDPALVSGEHELLRMYADIRAVSRPLHVESEPGADLLQSPQEYLHAWLRSLDADAEGLPPRFTAQLLEALAHYDLDSLERTPVLEQAAYRLFVAQQRADTTREIVVDILDRRLADSSLGADTDDALRDALDRLVLTLEGRDAVIADRAREVRFRVFDEPLIAAAREPVYAAMEAHIESLLRDPGSADRAQRVAAIVDCARPLAPRLTAAMSGAQPASRRLLLEAMARRYYRVRSIAGFTSLTLEGHELIVAPYEFEDGRRLLISGFVALDQLAEVAGAITRHIAGLDRERLVMVDLYAEHERPAPSPADLAQVLHEQLRRVPTPPALHRIVVAVAEPRRGRGMSAIDLFTFRPGPDGLHEHEVLRGLHPLMGHRVRLWRLREFTLQRLPSEEDIYAYRGVAKTNDRDERLFVLAEVRDLTAVRDELGRVTALPELEQVLVRALERIRRFQAPRPFSRRLLWNRVILHCWPVIELDPDEIRGMIARVSQATVGLGLEMVAVQGRLRCRDGVVREQVLNFFAPAGRDVVVEVSDPPQEPLHPLDEGTRRIISARRRGMLHPAEIVHLLAPKQRIGDQPAGEFVELELDDDGALAPVARPVATNPAGVVVGTIVNYTERYPEGMRRVILLGDPTRSLGALAEPECRRIIAAMDLAERLGVPLEWIALSAGAKIAMDSGTETMDWISAVLRRIVLFTQAGNELNVLVAGINVGAQPYFNAEATMLMHTRGALIMTPQSAMVLTGKEALDFSGAVSAEDNFGIGGYERIMGPNGQAQYWAPDLAAACRLLLEYYEHTYVAPGERFPRPAHTSDPASRDVRAAPHRAPGSPLQTVGDIFSSQTNGERKQPFAMRAVMRAVIDADHRPLERWQAMRRAEVAIVWDAHLGGQPATVIGIESRPLARHGELPADGPEMWTSGTLFPHSAKKIARAINAASGRRAVVVLANLAGFDGSPESMRECQLEFGAEIGRAVVNFDGPIVFCVISRYHGGAFVVFSQQLNPGLETVALEGARASVIGGAPAAAVVFAREVEHAASADPRMQELDRRIVAADGAERRQLRAQRSVLWEEVAAQQRRAFAERFDAAHSVERAVRVGSVQRIIAAAQLRPFLIDAVGRGIARTLADRASSPATSNGDGHAELAHPALS